MIPITFLPMNKKMELKEGNSILDAASSLGIDITGVCAGKGTCGKCKVLVTKGNIQKETQEELKHLSASEIKSGVRLGCRFYPTEETCVLLTDETKREIKIRKKEYRKLPKREMGVVFDIGTTTVEMAVYDLSTKEKITQLSKKNPQNIGGMDVVSRILYCLREQKNLYQMQNLIHRCCNELLKELFLQFKEEKKVIKEKITKMIVMGNTAMSHLFLGKSVDGLAKAPFYQAFSGGVALLNKEEKFDISPQGDIIILPNINGYVGSDTLGCMFAVDLQRQKGIQFILDIGTNAEMVLLYHGKLDCCSVAAGPAFEGASVCYGMKAVDGSIKGVSIQKEKLILEVVGNQIPKGICASGMIDFLSVMIELGEIDKTGKITKGEELVIYSGEKPVILTQKDIREIQLAKAAIYSGICTLLKKYQIKECDIDKFYLAGAFGSNIHLENAKKIGLIPSIHADKIQFIGNGAIEGGGRILIEQISNLSIEECSKKINHVELAEDETFKEYFIKSIDF